MRDLTRRIAAGFYRMGIGIGTEKTPVELRARIEKKRRFSPLCKPSISFCAPQGWVMEQMTFRSPRGPVFFSATRATTTLRREIALKAVIGINRTEASNQRVGPSGIPIPNRAHTYPDYSLIN
jgi:hypothetical protein